MKEAQRKFINNNKLSYKFEDNVHVLSNCWGDSSFAFHFDDDTKFDVLENVYFPDNLYAIYHSDKLKYEFIFQPILSNSVLIGRSFDFIYKGNVFKASYGDPTSEFKLLADAFVDNLLEMDDNRSCRNFKYFVDYYQSVKNQILNTEYSTIVPINFFIQGPFNMLEESELFVFFKHVNFYMAFFDRKSPWIFIDNHSKNHETYKVPCLFNINKEFPSQINATPINSDLLDLFSIARSAYTPRLQYLFYFQVLEFAAYYFIEHEFTNKIKGIIKNPDLLLQIDKYSKELIDELQNKYYKNNTFFNKNLRSFPQVLGY